MRPCEPARGFTYVWALAAVALLSVGLSVVGPMWADQARRDREQELLRVGSLYAQAIADYYVLTPGTAKQFPTRLEELLQDDRFWGTRRHLRKLYPDPMQPQRPWGVLRGADGRITGVFSQDTAQPFLQAPVTMGVVQLGVAAQYQQWQFRPMASALEVKGQP